VAAEVVVGLVIPQQKHLVFLVEVQEKLAPLVQVLVLLVELLVVLHQQQVGEILVEVLVQMVLVVAVELAVLVELAMHHNLVEVAETV